MGNNCFKKKKKEIDCSGTFGVSTPSQRSDRILTKVESRLAKMDDHDPIKYKFQSDEDFVRSIDRCDRQERRSGYRA
jgi:hypothetical protein